MQPALAPAMHNIRPGQTASDQEIQQTLLMARHHMHNAPPGPLLDPSEAGSPSSDIKRAGKRELSTSKRAAQNRQAQRAFRQRKEGHIKKLEEQVRDYQALAESFKAVQEENYQLRDYIINLQSRLIESQGDFPPAPNNIDLRQPLGGGPGNEGPAAAGGHGQNGTSAESAQSAALKENKSGIDPSLSRT